MVPMERIDTFHPIMLFWSLPYKLVKHSHVGQMILSNDLTTIPSGPNFLQNFLKKTS